MSLLVIVDEKPDLQLRTSLFMQLNPESLNSLFENAKDSLKLYTQ